MTRGLVVISPHLDDGVFGCSALLAAHADAVVMTVFAGRPPAFGALPPWDEAAGFRAGDDVVGARRTEDRAALRVFGAQPVWLPFLDAQYGRSPSIATIVPVLESALTALDTSTVCIPLGLFHRDHVLAHTAALVVLRRHPRWQWVAYEEPTYRRVPDALTDRLEALRSAGVVATPLGSLPSPERKRDAMSCYASQLRALGTPGRPGFADALGPEHYWALTG